MAETKTNANTDSAGIFEGIGSWLGSLAGDKPSNEVPLVKPTSENKQTDAPPKQTLPWPENEHLGMPVTPEDKEEAEKQKAEVLPSMLKFLQSLNTSNSSAKKSAGDIAAKMIYQPTPTQFVQYIPPQKKRIAPTSGRK